MITLQMIGNLGSDPERKTTQAGKDYCRFSLASNKKIKGEKITTWVNVTCFDDHKTDFIMKYVRKGTRLFVEGEPQARYYESNGDHRASLDLTLSFGSKVEICSSEPRDNDNGDGGGDTDEPEDDLEDDDIPF